MIRVVIADDQRLMREGLAMILELEEDLQVVGLASNGIDAIELVKQNETDVVLMDIRMPNMDGVEGTKRILSLYPHIKILMLTTFNDKELIISALESGARGYLLKDMPSKAIIQAIHSVNQGGIVMQADVKDRILAELRNQNKRQILSEAHQKTEKKLAYLSIREKEVLGLLGLGYNNKEISAHLFISEGTAKNHISAIIRKLEIRDRTQAALFALKTGITKDI
jgi:DNA-binding NarL/FixJ family response regulator